MYNEKGGEWNIYRKEKERKYKTCIERENVTYRIRQDTQEGDKTGTTSINTNRGGKGVPRRRERKGKRKEA